MVSEYVLGVLISGALFVSFVMRIFSLTAWFEIRSDCHVGLVPHTSDLVPFFWASSDSLSGECSIVASSKGGGPFLWLSRTGFPIRLKCRKVEIGQEKTL